MLLLPGILAGSKLGAGVDRYQAAILGDNPLMYLRMGTVISPVVAGAVVPDISGNNYNGALGNSSGYPLTAGILPGTPAKCMIIGGTGPNNTVNVFIAPNGVTPIAPAILNLSYPCSVEGWWNFNSFSSNQEMICCGNSGALAVYSVGNKIYFGHNGISNDGISAANLTAGVTYHIVVTISSSGVYNFYFDGVQDSSTGTVTGSYSSTQGGSIAFNPYFSIDKFSGLAQEVALYNYALTSTQVLNHYLVGANISP